MALSSVHPQERRARERRLSLMVARRLRALRQARGLTQDELAAGLGVRRESLSRYEHGERAISLALLLDMAEALDCSMFDLLPVSQEPPEPTLATIITLLQERPDWRDAVARVLATEPARPDTKE